MYKFLTFIIQGGRHHSTPHHDVRICGFLPPLIGDVGCYASVLS